MGSSAWEGNLSRAQYGVSMTLGEISCLLSLVGSLCIIRLARLRGLMDNPYNRLLLGMSIGDVMVSVTVLLQPFLSQGPVLDGLWVGGNTATCSALGFGMRFPLTVSLYSSFLSFYFLRRVSTGKRSSRARTSAVSNIDGRVAFVEGLGHCMAFLIPVSFGVAGLVTNSFNHFELLKICKFATYPEDCLEKNVECVRGGEITVKLDLSYMAVLFSSALFSIVCTVLVYVRVRRQMRATILRSFQGADEERKTKVIRKVASQALCYTAAYLNGTIWPPIVKIILDASNADGNQGEPINFLLVTAVSVFFPLQGFLNCLIYVRPDYLRWRKWNPDRSRCWAMLHAVVTNEEPRNLAAVCSSGRNTNPIARDLSQDDPEQTKAGDPAAVDNVVVPFELTNS